MLVFSRNRDSAPLQKWHVGTRVLVTGKFPLIMGILNRTPDSFSDGGRFAAIDLAVEHARSLLEQGADILDIGGESTRPGSLPVSLEEELDRVLPIIERIVQFSEVPLSVDTTKSEVARQALRAGAVIVNDVSGLQFDPLMIPVCAEERAAVICMHIQGTPATMQSDPQYVAVVPEVCDFLKQRTATLVNQGISAERIALDPGIGFGKTANHNLELLRNIGALRALGWPVCVGHSRKQFLKKLLGRPVDERLFATVGISVALAIQSTDIIRVHDVAATRDALLAWQAVAVPPLPL